MEYPVAMRGEYTVLWGKSIESPSCSNDIQYEQTNEENSKVEGKHGDNSQAVVTYDQGDDTVANGYEKKCDGTKLEGNGSDGGEDEDYDEEDEEEEEYYVYYSAEQLRQLIGYLVPIESPRDRYSEIMEPLPGWLSLAWSSLPVPEPTFDWTQNHLILQLLAKTQDIWRQKLRRMLTITLSPTPLTEWTIALIADYALPYARDVRWAWMDEEGHAKTMRSGAAVPEWVSEEPRPDPCVIQ
jgi:hypothetical protein